MFGVLLFLVVVGALVWLASEKRRERRGRRPPFRPVPFADELVTRFGGQPLPPADLVRFDGAVMGEIRRRGWNRYETADAHGRSVYVVTVPGEGRCVYRITGPDGFNTDGRAVYTGRRIA